MDVVHVYVTAMHIGEEILRDVGSWNDMTCGNIGFTLFLWLSRVLWFVFVGIKGVDDEKKRQ
jgi:hypothetical protein